MRRGLAVLGATLALAFLAFGGSALAANRYTVTPAFQAVQLDNQGAANVSIEIENNTTLDQSFRLTAADFGSLNESGGVAFLGAPASELDHPYGLVSWLVVGANVVFVPAGKSVTVKAAIENRESLSPGGHYGAILATAVTDTGQTKNVAPQVGLHAVLSSLILLTKSGGAKPDLKLVSESFSRLAFKLPGVIDQRFQDAGNVHVVPRGTIEVRDPLGRVVEHGAINDDSVFVLPESFRKITATLTSQQAAWMPGLYSVVTKYRYDGSDASTTFTDSVWYAGTVIVWVAWAVVALGVAYGGWRLWRRRGRR